MTPPAPTTEPPVPGRAEQSSKTEFGSSSFSSLEVCASFEPMGKRSPCGRTGHRGRAFSELRGQRNRTRASRRYIDICLFEIVLADARDVRVELCGRV